MTFKRFMSLTAMALLWTGSQIPVYLYGKSVPLTRILWLKKYVQAAFLPTSIVISVALTDGFGL